MNSGCLAGEPAAPHGEGRLRGLSQPAFAGVALACQLPGSLELPGSLKIPDLNVKDHKAAACPHLTRWPFGDRFSVSSPVAARITFNDVIWTSRKTPRGSASVWFVLEPFIDG